MPPTLKQLAAFTGLSVPTISEILNNKQRVYRADTRKRVMDAARQMGYRPNGSARSMKSGRFGVVALLQSSRERTNYLPRPLLESIESALNERELLLLLGRVADEQLVAPDGVPHLLKTWSADGLLINYVAGYPERMMELILRHHIPAIWINSKHATDCVYPDDEDAARLATGHLIALGHREVAFVNYNFAHREAIPVHYSSVDRYNGYRQALGRADLAGREIRPRDRSLPMNECVEYSLHWLRQPRRPTAVLTYAPGNAIAIMYAARSLGLKVPEDLSIMTFDDRICEGIGTNIDTMILPETQIGQRAVENLLSKIQNPLLSLPPLPLPLEMATGWTTAPPGPAAKRNARSKTRRESDSAG